MARAGSIAMIDRRVLSRHRGATAVLVALVALAAGATMALVAGGRRAATSYSRFVAWSGGADVRVGGWPQEGMDSAIADRSLTELSALPQVAAAQRILGVGGGLVLPDGRNLPPNVFTVAVVDVTSPALGKVKVMAGRLPHVDAPDEVVVGFSVAEQYGLHAGDRLGLRVSESGPPEPLTLVGIIAAVGGFPSLSARPDATAFLTPAFLAAHPEQVDWTNGGVALTLHGGDAQVPELQQAIEAAGIPVLGIGRTRDLTDGVTRLVRIQAGVLWIMAAVVAAAALMALVQLQRREAARTSGDLGTVRLLGVRRQEIARAGARRGARLGLSSAAAAVVVAIASSPLFPLAVARTADPNHGLHADAVVLGIGALATAALVTLLTVGATFLASGGAAERRPPASRSVLADLGRGLPPAPATGYRLAFQPAGTGPGATVRLGILGLVTLLAFVVASVSVKASFGHVLDEPALTGGTWDALLEWDDPDAADAAGRAIAGDPAVAGFARGGFLGQPWDMLSIDGRPVPAMVLEPGVGVTVAVDRGRAPIGADEIALGEAEMDALGVGIGDTVDVIGGESSAPVTATVVGRAILAAPTTIALGRGHGAAATLELLRRLGLDPPQSYFVRFRDAADPQQQSLALADRLGANFSYPRGDLAAVDSLRSLRSLPVLLMLVLTAFAVVALLHRLVSTTAARRRDLAVLRSLGLTGRQLVVAGTTQGGVTSALALVGAVPAGLLVASAGWNWIAHYLGVIPRVVVPVGPLVIVAGALLALGAAAGSAVAARARRRAPGVVLRSE